MASPHLPLQHTPRIGLRDREVQPFGSISRYPLGLDDRAIIANVEALNYLLADTIMLRDMYKKHHWQVSGPTFYSLHLMFDKHASEQSELIDVLAERVQTLGGVAVAMGFDVAEMTRIERPARGREEPAVQLSRTLEAHEHILLAARRAARQAAENGDDGTNDVLVSEIVRTNEMQLWFVAEHLADVRLLRTRDS
jgi:starvation-inducible DNA-binding protein